MREIIEKIENFEPEDGEWFELEDILMELYDSENPDMGLNAMIGVYEKYPDEDNDILWGMLHGVEGMKGYEAFVIESIKRKPSFFCVLMVKRILNTGVEEEHKKNLIKLLGDATKCQCVTEYVREFIEDNINTLQEENKR